MKMVIQVPMEKDLLTQLDRRAAIQQVSRAALIRSACLSYLREMERREWDQAYEEGYRRIPDQTTEQESLAWLAAANLPSEEWPEAPRGKA